MSELLSSASPKNKEQLIEDIIQLGSRTGQFSALRGKDTDVFIERKIVNAEYYEADGHGEELIEKMYIGLMFCWTKAAMKQNTTKKLLNCHRMRLLTRAQVRLHLE